MEKIINLTRKLCCFPIRLYQYLISPCLISRCRFYPSCSQYALDAIECHGVVRGIILSYRRLLKCHPWSQGGYDPVLPKKRNDNGY